ncbi:hypothetical protein [Pseudomonas sp. 28 E 9]|nr:hypothetical protein [Pseudomonas sp. 28 E 9]CRM06836.1 hypothetical protein [Pseudomonas sp. 28 E 9]
MRHMHTLSRAGVRNFRFDAEAVVYNDLLNEVDGPSC